MWGNYVERIRQFGLQHASHVDSSIQAIAKAIATTMWYSVHRPYHTHTHTRIQLSEIPPSIESSPPLSLKFTQTLNAHCGVLGLCVRLSLSLSLRSINQSSLMHNLRSQRFCSEKKVLLERRRKSTLTRLVRFRNATHKHPVPESGIFR